MQTCNENESLLLVCGSQPRFLFSQGFFTYRSCKYEIQILFVIQNVMLDMKCSSILMFTLFEAKCLGLISPLPFNVQCMYVQCVENLSECHFIFIDTLIFRFFVEFWIPRCSCVIMFNGVVSFAVWNMTNKFAL